MKFICIAAMALLCYSCHRKMTAQKTEVTQAAYTDPRGNPMLLGIHTKEDLQQSPYKDWFDKNYDTYAIDSATANALKSFVKNKKFEIFMGTWCGDSKREVPRMFKILEYAGVKPSQIKMIMVDDHDSTYKQSPAHEEKGKSIHRVPDLIVYDGNKEINRIVESPVVSLEKDMFAILSNTSYEPNYKGASYLFKLTKEKDLNEIVKDSILVAEKLKTLVKNSADLNTLGYVWMKGGETGKALLVFQLNAMIFPNEANVYDSLGEINLKMNNKDAARKYYQKVIEMQPENAHAKKMLALTPSPSPAPR